MKTITTLRFNIKSTSANAKEAYETLKSKNLNTSFRSGFNNLKSAWLCVDVEQDSKEHEVANKYLFDENFNKSK